jgi:NAD(P)-dependent dehydrogenase (short-subunit alcohol dehydrogenase family)
MIENKKGSIILISSAVTINGGGGGIAYAASKAALNGISSKLNYELLPKGIRANIISPGVIDTPMFRKKNPDKPEVNEKLISQIPARRIGRPDDIANMALFLASDCSSFICGQDIVIDGGRTVYRNPHLS